MPKPKKQKYKRSIAVGEGPDDTGKGPKAARQLRAEGWRGDPTDRQERLYPPKVPMKGHSDSREPVTKPIKITNRVKKG